MRRHIRVALTGLLLCSCDAITDSDQPRVVHSILTQVLPQTRMLTLALDRSVPITVEYWTESHERLRVEVPASLSPSVPLTRLRAGRAYQYRVLGTDHRGTFAVNALPPALAGLEFQATGVTTAPLVLLHLYDADPAGYRGFVVVDSEGEVVWQMPTVDLPFGATRRANGNFVFLDKGRGLLEVTPVGEIVARLPQDLEQREMHHDVIATPQNTILFIAFDRRVHSGQDLRGEAVWEWTPETGAVVKRWSSWDHLSPELDRGPRFNEEWIHVNSLAVGPRGNIIMSAHFFNQVLSVSADWQRLEWRLGGVNATVAVAAPDQFSGQHTARELGGNRVLLFDNNIEGVGGSRVTEFELEGNSARVVWQWRPQRTNFASAVGSARRLPGGNTLVNFGMSAGLAGSTGPVEVYEVTPAGTTAWHLVVPNARLSYRAEPLGSIGLERAAR